jgi:NADH-quinone oxidoreductase subunit G
MSDIKAAPSTFTIVVDGREVQACPGEVIIAAAERAGTYIPRFCYHPRMKPVGMCRMCLVEVKGPRGFSLQPACFVEVADGQEVVTTSEKVLKAQDGILEFLLINHPLDCPVCDKGGECPLQDQTLAYGPGESRFIEEKRHWAKPIPISPLVDLDRERCIQCARCTRFAEEWAGEPLIDFFERGDRIEVATFPDHPFASYFSGNTVQICPVGALTATPYRFRARPWDLEQVESTCTACSVGCRIVVQSSSNRLVRYLGVDSEPVNWSWLCDKGRFSFEAVNSGDRVAHPLVRREGELVRASWAEALDAAASVLEEARSARGAEGVALVGGARLANEDAYAWARLAKGVLGTDSVDCQLGDGLAAEAVLGLPRATIEEACGAPVLVLLGPDLREELPVLYLRIRDAVLNRGLRVLELSPSATAMTRHCASSLLYRPGEAGVLARALVQEPGPAGDVAGVAREDLESARRLLSSGEPVVLLGRPSLGESGVGIADAAGVMAKAWRGARFLPALRRANVHGSLDMGLAPGMLPGRVSLEDGRRWYGAAWGKVPERRGAGTAGILAAAAGGRLGALVLLGSDPASDFPDRRLASRALRQVRTVAVDSFLTESSAAAEVVLPAAMFAERPGTTTNIEGRISVLGQKVVPPGVAWPDWMIAVELSARLGAELPFGSLEQIWEEVERVSPVHRGLTYAALLADEARDGLVAPLPRARVEIGRRPAAGDGAVRRLDPMATPGIDAAERQGSPSRSALGVASDINGASDGDGGRPGIPGAGEAPRPVSFAGPAEPTAPPPLDGYSLRLVSGRVLYDGGTLNQACPSLGPLAPRPSVRLNPHELDRLGVASGQAVRLRSSRASLVLEAVADAAVPRGVAQAPFNVGAEDAGELMEAGSVVTEVRLETIDG